MQGLRVGGGLESANGLAGAGTAAGDSWGLAATGGVSGIEVETVLEAIQDAVVDGRGEAVGDLLGGDGQLAWSDLVGQKGEAPVRAALVAGARGSAPGQITGLGAVQCPHGPG